ncbi:MAG: hypothetical protein J6V07_03120 [Clostridia bacterium]|nr:hypothetical protein [Clostridia bacterium]
MKKILSVLLVAVMLFGAVVGLIPEAQVITYAAESGEDTNKGAPVYKQATDLALVQKYESVEEKIAGDQKNGHLMPMVDAKVNGVTYRLYANPYTGEVIYQNLTTKEALTTNPFDVGADSNYDGTKRTISDSVKAQLLSQVVVSYKGSDGNLKTMYSFTEAAQRGQIQIKPITNGIRVQYTIGRENTTYLMPAWITVERFEEEILGPLRAYEQELIDLYGEGSFEHREFTDFVLRKFEGSYDLRDPYNPANGEKELEAMQAAYPITAKKDANGKFYAIYTVAEGMGDVSKATLETMIRTYCPDYTYEDLEKDNAFTEYVSKEETLPLFKLSLEYTINLDDGSLDVRLPANGILYDETLFQLESISTLNYMGAGRMSTLTYEQYATKALANADGDYAGNAGDEILFDGYLFYPDGSGTLFEFSDLYTETLKPNVSWTSKVYGQDYAYYTVEGQSQESVRLPVYGVVSTQSQSVEQVYNAERSEYDLVPKRTGFVAILEEGDAMTSLTAAFGATRHDYASVYPVYYPRPKDTYDLADSISVSGNTEWTVVADRKYTGSYRTRFILLSDNAEYAPSWVGMATAYRDYLKDKGVLNRITLDEVEEQIPLYLEVFGAYETTKQILSIPVDVKVPLTTFEDVQSIYNDLSASDVGITNVNFKLTGFANGGMSATYPAKLKWESAVGGKRGFSDLIAAADEKGFGVYPDFDFTYISNEATFDGVSLKGLGARTVDNRYCSKQVYNAVYQQFESYLDMCVSTSLMNKYYEKFSDKLSNYQDTGAFGLSVSTLGSDLNSNFDEDNPINREEAKEDVENLLGAMKASYKTLMLGGGNAYTLGYADHILGIPLTGSNFRYASASVPFMAMVLHGYVNYTGTAINMSGDTDYNLLRFIENGAYPYYLLSYNTSNTMLLKKDEMLNKYYSIRYDIWRWSDADNRKGDGMIIEQYRLINDMLSDLQAAEMVDHQFIRGERVLKDYEKEANKASFREAVLTAVRNEVVTSRSELLAALREGLALYNAVAPYIDNVADAAIKKLLADCDELGIDNAQKKTLLITHLSSNFPFTEEETDSVADAYMYGNGLDDFKVRRALEIVVNADFDKIWSSVSSIDGIDRLLTPGEIATLKGKVFAEIKAAEVTLKTPESVALGNGFAAVLGRVPTDRELCSFFEMLYLFATNEDEAAEIAKTFAFTLADGDIAQDEEKDAKVAELLAFVESNASVEKGALVSALAAILGHTPTADEIDAFNEMIYLSGLDDNDGAKRAERANAFTFTLATGELATGEAKEAKVAELLALVKDCIENKQILVVPDSVEIAFDFNETASNATSGADYADTDYTLEDERLILVTYKKTDGTLVRFVLNYNIFDVTVKLDGKEYTLEPYSAERIDPKTTGGEG